MKKISSVLFMSLVVTTLSFAWSSQDEPSDHQTKSFSVQKGGVLKVDVEPGAVTIEPWSKDEVHIEADGINERHPERLVMSQSGNTVSVDYKDSRRSTNNVHFTINVPVKFNVEIQTSGAA